MAAPIRTLLRAVQSPVGRVVTGLVALTWVGFILHRIGAASVWSTLDAAAVEFPVIAALELAILACTTLGLRAMYGDAGRSIPWGQFARAGFIGYSVMGLVPVGRTAAEVTRGALLSRYAGRARAACAAARMQAVAMLADALISIPAAIAVLWLLGPSLLALLIAANFAVTFLIGAGILAIGRRSRVGRWIGRRFARAEQFGADLDAMLAAEPTIPWRPLAWEFFGRALQVVQYGVLVMAVGGTFGAGNALLAQAIHLVGNAAGELLPAQLGATETTFALSAHELGLTAAGALSIALLAHLAQLLWVIVGAFTAMFSHASPVGAARAGAVTAEAVITGEADRDPQGDDPRDDGPQDGDPQDGASEESDREHGSP